MAKFFVGQRVRVVAKQYIGNGPHPSGLEGIVIACGRCVGLSGKFYEYEVETLDGRRLVGDSHELEPILYSHQPCDADFKESLDKLLDGLPA